MARRTKSYGGRQPFIVDPGSVTRSDGGRQVDFDALPEQYRSTNYTIVVGTGGAAIDAVSIPLATALTQKARKGTLLYFGETKELARVSADANIGATALAVDPLAVAIEAGDMADIPGSGSKRVKAGTAVVELSSGKVVPRAVRPGSETCIGLLETDADEGPNSDALSGYGVILGGVVYENLLPDATGDPKLLPDAYKTELQAAGTGWSFQRYGDDRAS